MNIMQRSVLDKLAMRNMFLHAIEEDEQLPFVKTNLDTHYVMQGGEIVFHGNLTMLVGWLNKL